MNIAHQTIDELKGKSASSSLKRSWSTPIPTQSQQNNTWNIMLDVLHVDIALMFCYDVACSYKQFKWGTNHIITKHNDVQNWVSRPPEIGGSTHAVWSVTTAVESGHKDTFRSHRNRGSTMSRIHAGVLVVYLIVYLIYAVYENFVQLDQAILGHMVVAIHNAAKWLPSRNLLILDVYY